jgi:hypothetical protein
MQFMIFHLIKFCCCQRKANTDETPRTKSGYREWGLVYGAATYAGPLNCHQVDGFGRAVRVRAPSVYVGSMGTDSAAKALIWWYVQGEFFNSRDIKQFKAKFWGFTRAILKNTYTIYTRHRDRVSQWRHADSNAKLIETAPFAKLGVL